MAEKKYQWHKIAGSVDELVFGSNQLCITEVKGKKITLALWQQTVHAFAWKCPHAGGIMADGYLDPLGNVVCPLHRYKFNMQTGRNSSGEGFYLKTFPVTINEKGVFVGFEESSGLWGLFR